MTTEIVKTESPMAMMQIALKGGADIGQLEKMLELQERWDANEAKKAYHLAMANFKASPPKINKDKTVAFKATKYSHASLGNVTEKINAGLSEHGLSASWGTKQDQSGITVTCKITHKQGYSESTSLTALPDNSGAKNNIQSIGSTVSYLSRYTLLSLTGLATHDQDDDGRATALVYLNTEQIAKVIELMTAAKVDSQHFLKYLKVESVEKIPVTQFNRVIKDLETVKAGAK